MSSLLQLALEARIPLIHATTTDLINLEAVVSTLVPGRSVTAWAGSKARGDISIATEEVEGLNDLYEELVDEQQSLILINKHEDSPYVFHAGEVPVPKGMVVDLLEKVAPKKAIPELADCFAGLTLKSVAEVMRLTMAQDKKLTPAGVVAMRATLAGKLQGLTRVDTQQDLYQAPPQLATWVKLNARYFLEGPDDRLTPRGILLDGQPGVGKTSAAMYIANQFKVPLYRLDLGAALSKWIGESEQSLARILSTLDQEAGSVCLLDEIEKLFTTTDDSGVTQRLLSQLLWWLASRKSKVLVVMTTNDLDKLPKELYRAGRIDAVLTMLPLDKRGAAKLALDVLKLYIKAPKPAQVKLTRQVVGRKVKKSIPHALVVQTVNDLVKEKGWLLPG